MPSSLSTNQFGLCSKDRSGSCNALSYCAIIIVSKSTTVHQPTADNCTEQRKNGNYISDEREKNGEKREIQRMNYAKSWLCNCTLFGSLTVEAGGVWRRLRDLRQRERERSNGENNRYNR